MILRFTLFSSVVVGIVLSLFIVTEDIICSDTALYSMSKISLRETLNKKNLISKMNDLNDRFSMKCFYLIKGKDTLNLKTPGKKTQKFTLNLKTDITNESKQ